MAILAHIGSHNRFAIIMVAETPSQAESGMQIPSVFAAAISAIEVHFGPLGILDVPPHLRVFKILENASEKHVIPLLFDVNAAGPVADVEAIAAEATVEKLVAWFTAQIPHPGRQMRPHGSANLPPFPNGTLAAHLNDAVFGRNSIFFIFSFFCNGLGVVINRIEIEIVVERPSTIGAGSCRFVVGPALAGRGGLGWGFVGRRRRQRRVDSAVILVRAELAFEAEIGILEEDAGEEEAGAADGELVERGPASGRLGIAGGDEIGDDGGEHLPALGLPASVANERGEFGAGAGEPGPVARVFFKLVKEVQNDIVREPREHGLRIHCF